MKNGVQIHTLHNSDATGKISSGRFFDHILWKNSSELLGELDANHIVCIETCLPQNLESLFTHMAEAVERRGGDVAACSYEHVKVSDLAESLEGIVRQFAPKHTGGRTIVIVCNLPEIPQDQLSSIARLFRYLNRHHLEVVCLVEPKNAALLEYLNRAGVMGSERFRITQGEGDLWDAPVAFDQALALSNGAYSLMQVLEGCEGDEAGGLTQADCAHFGEVLDRSVTEAAQTFSSEQRQLLYTMIACGKGRLSDVLAVTGQGSGKDLSFIAYFLPLVSVEEKTNSFWCGAVADEGVFRYLPKTVAAIKAFPQEQKRRLIAMTEQQGAYAHSACLIATFGLTDAVARHLVREAPHYVAAGSIRLIRQALAATQSQSSLSHYREQAELACTLACGNHREVQAAEKQFSRRDRSQAEPVLVALRSMRESLNSPKEAEQALSGDTIPVSLRSHIACWKTACTKPEELRARLTEAMDEQDQCAELFQADCRFFHALLDAQTGVWPQQLLSREDAFGLWAQTLFLGYKALTAGEAVLGEAQGIAKAWDTFGDALGSALAHLICAVQLMRNGSPQAAYPALLKAQPMLRGQDAPSLTEIIVLLRAQIQYDKQPSVAEQLLGSCRSTDGKAIGAWIRAAHGGYELKGSEAPLPDHLLWFAKLLRESDRKFQKSAPVEWDIQAGRWGTSKHHGEFQASQLLGGKPCVRAKGEGPKLLEVSMLGHFEVKVDGEPILLNRWPRRSSRVLLGMLVAKRGHTIRRVDFLNAVWPGVDYLTGRPRIYAAVSTLRDVVKQKGTTTKFIVGGDGRISLNPTCVICDVDKCEALVREILSRGTDDDRLFQATQDLLELYQGDLVVSPQDTSGMMLRREEELKHAYVDALTRAAQRALEVGPIPSAALFAKHAHEAAPIREDVMAVYVKVLARQGRYAEIWGAYREFSQQLFDVMGTAPSAKLRMLLEAIQSEEGVASPENRSDRLL